MKGFSALILCLFLFCPPVLARRIPCPVFFDKDSIVTDYYYMGQIIRYRVYYEGGEITHILGFEREGQPLFKEYYSDLVIDSIDHYNQTGLVPKKTKFLYSRFLKNRLGRQFSTIQNYNTRFKDESKDIIVKTEEFYEEGIKVEEVLFENGEMANIKRWGESGFTEIQDTAGLQEFKEEMGIVTEPKSLKIRSPKDVYAYLTQNSEIRDIYYRYIARYPKIKGDIIIKFDINPEGTVARAFVMKTNLKCRNIPTDFLGTVKNLKFPDNPDYGFTTVTFPFRFRKGAEGGIDGTGPRISKEALEAEKAARKELSVKRIKYGIFGFCAAIVLVGIIIGVSI
jgi:hypothetical protein